MPTAIRTARWRGLASRLMQRGTVGASSSRYRDRDRGRGRDCGHGHDRGDGHDRRGGPGFGLLGDILIGILGAVFASWLFPTLGVHLGGGILASIIAATIGAVILLLIVRLIRRAT